MPEGDDALVRNSINNKVHLLEGAKLISSGDIEINAMNLELEQDALLVAGVNQNGQLEKVGVALLNLGNHIENAGTIAAGEKLILASKYTINNKSLFFSFGDMELLFITLTNDEGAEILSSGDILMARQIENGTDGVKNFIKANFITNASGRIESMNGMIEMHSLTIENKRKDFDIVLVDNGEPELPFDTCEDCSGRTGTATVAESKKTVIVGNNPDAVSAQIISRNGINFYTETLRNEYSQISSSARIYISTDDIINKGSNHFVKDIERDWQVFHDTTVCARAVLGVCQEWDCFYKSQWVPDQAPRESITYITNLANIPGGQATAIIESATELIIDINNMGTNQNIGAALQTGESTNSLGFQTAYNVPRGILSAGESSLFMVNQKKGHDYLIETRDLFKNIDNYLGSDYFFEHTDVSLDDLEHNQRLGDPNYEWRLVSDQIFDKKGTQFTEEAITSAVEQMQELYDNALKAKDELQLTVGVKLTAEQIKNLSYDIVWMEERKVNGQTVLYPQFYVAQASAEKTQVSAASLSANNINIKSANFVNSGGEIIAKEKIQLSASQNIVNKLGIIKGDKILFFARDNILNRGGTISGRRLAMKTGGSIINESLRDIFYLDKDNYFDILLSESIIEVDGEVIESEVIAPIESIESIEPMASIDESTVSDLSAEELDDIIEGTNEVLSQESKNSFLVNHTGHLEQRSYEEEIALLESLLDEKELSLIAGGEIRNIGASITSYADAHLEAGGDIIFDSLALEQSFDIRGRESYRDAYKKSNLKSELLISGSLFLRSDSNLKIKASDFIIGEDAVMELAGNIIIENGYDLNDYEAKTMSAESEGDIIKSSEKITRVISGSIDKSVLSSVLSFGGNASILGSKMEIIGSEISAGGVLSLELDELKVSSALSTHKDFSNTNISITDYNVDYNHLLGVSSLNLSVEFSNKDDEESEETGEITYTQLLAKSLVIKSTGDIDLEGIAISVENDIDISTGASINLVGAKLSESEYSSSQEEIWTLSLDEKTNLGLEYEVNKDEKTELFESGGLSFIFSENGTINLEAGENLRIKGAEIISANGDLELHGEKGVEILSLETNSKSDSYSLSTNIFLGTNIAQLAAGAVNFKLGLGQEVENSFAKSTNHIHSSLEAQNGTLSITSAKDFKMEGAFAKAANIVLDIEGDFYLSSVQNTVSSDFQGVSASVNLSYGEEISGALSYGDANSEATKAWVDEITSIVGSESVLIKVGGDAYMKGSTIANIRDGEEDGADSYDGTNLLIDISGNLNLEDIKNYDKFDSKIQGIGIGYSSSSEYEDTLASYSLNYEEIDNDKEGLSYSTIGFGEILTGGTTDISGLNRDFRKQEIITRDDKDEFSFAYDLGPVMNIIQDYKSLSQRTSSIAEDSRNFRFEDSMKMTRHAEGILKDSSDIFTNAAVFSSNHGNNDLADKLEQRGEDLGAGAEFLHRLDLKNRAKEELGVVTSVIGYFDGGEEFLVDTEVWIDNIAAENAQRIEHYLLEDHRGNTGNWETDAELASRIIEESEVSLIGLDKIRDSDKLFEEIISGKTDLDFLANLRHSDKGKDISTLGEMIAEQIEGNIKNHFYSDSRSVTLSKVDLIDFIGVDISEINQWIDTELDKIAIARVKRDFEAKQEAKREREGLLGNLFSSLGTGVRELSESTVNFINTGNYEDDLELSASLNNKPNLSEEEEAFLQNRFDEIASLTATGYQQNSTNQELLSKLEGIIEGADNLRFDEDLEQERNDLRAELAQTEDSSEQNKLNRRIQAIDAKEERFNDTKNLLLAGKDDKEKLALKILSKLCNVMSYNMHGNISNNDNRDLSEFYLGELQEGNIAGASLAYSTGSGEWRQERGMHRINRQNNSNFAGIVESNLDASGRQVAIAHVDTNKDGKANHFILIAKNKNGQWIFMDHSSKDDDRRGFKVDWDKVHNVDYMEVVK